MKEDAQSAAGFRGQFCYMVTPSEVMTEGKAKRFKRPNLFQELTRVIAGFFDDPSGMIG